MIMRKMIGIILVILGAFLGGAVLTYLVPETPGITRYLTMALTYVAAVVVGLGGVLLAFGKE